MQDSRLVSVFRVDTESCGRLDITGKELEE